MTQTLTLLTIGEVAERTDLSVHALRFYEKEGLLLDEVRRSTNGRRLYSEDDVAWLTTCTWLRSSGMPLSEIRRYADFVRGGRGNELERLALLRAHRARILEQQVALDRCLTMITHKLAVYEEHVAGVGNDCTVPDADEF